MKLMAEEIEHWEKVKEILRKELGETTFSTWIAPLSCDGVVDGRVTLGAPSRFFRMSVETAYGSAIRDAWRRVDSAVRKVAFEIQAEAVEAAARPRLKVIDGAGGGSAAADGGGAYGDEMEAAPRPEPIRLNERMRFDSFVVGRPNQFAFNMAMRIAEDPSVPFNPLFLHGPSGLGKTHLLHAIAWRRRELFPDQKILYISAETFLVAFMRSLRGNSTLEFKEMLRSVDVLMIDDVHHIFGKNHSQEEFFQTFNSLIEQGRQVILSAECGPMELTQLDSKLRTRLSWGMSADLHPTDLELRQRILSAKAENALGATPELRIEPRVLEFLAQRLSADVRTLEGAVNRLFAIASMTGRPASVELAQRELNDLLRTSDRKVTVDEIQKKACQHYGIRLAELLSRRRDREVVIPRQVAMYLAKVLTQKSLPDIGSKFERDHTTVLHAIRKVEKQRGEDPAFDDDVERLRRDLEG